MIIVERLENAPPSMVCTIKEMKRGQVGWTMPWAYDYGTSSLNRDFPVFTEPHSFICLMVKKTDKGTWIVGYPKTGWFE
jgi:predicted dithiol-disulfide oxidoreductase (DUF899 family)